MTQADEAMEYARTHLQAVRIVWVDATVDTYGAVEAVRLCADRRVSGRIMGAVAQDKTLEGMLNRLLDSE